MLALALSLALLPARADVPPPEAEACSGKQIGDACPDPTSSGRCVDGTCSRATPDGEVEYGCVVCKFGTADGPGDVAPTKGCGCDSGAAGGGALALFGVALIVSRRTRRPAV